MRICQNPKCAKPIVRKDNRPARFCSAKCRRREQHLRYIARYPEERNGHLDELLSWKAANPEKTRRVKKRFFQKSPIPSWLGGNFVLQGALDAKGKGKT